MIQEVRVIPGIVAGVVLLAILGAGEARAHEIGVVIRVLDSEVEIEGFFEGDEPARGAEVTVASRAGGHIAAGQLGADGRWRFPRPTAGTFRVTIDAGPGHVAERSFTVETSPVDRDSPEATGAGTGADSPPASPSARDRSPLPWILAGVSIAVVLLVLMVRSRSLRRRSEPGT